MYRDDPRWIKARFDSIDCDGNPVKKGDDILFYPRTKTVLTGEKAAQAWRDFRAAAMDESMMTGASW